MTNSRPTNPSSQRIFYYNAFCVISDGLEARAGTISAPFSRFQAWKTVDGKKESGTHVNQLETTHPGDVE